MNPAIDFLVRRFSISDKTKLLVGDYTTFLSIKKTKHLVQRNEICTCVYFIVKGYFIVYKYSEEGKLIIDWILGPGDIMYAPESFRLQQVTGEAIQAITDAEVYYITHAQLAELEKDPEFKDIRIDLEVEYRGRGASDKEIRDLTKAEDRYALFLKRYAHVVKYLSDKQIAAFIGVDPSTIAKIKGSSRK